MTDIVERLRSDGEDERQRFRESRCTLAPLLNEAAAEVERLRAALQEILNHSDYRTGAYLDQVCDMRQIARAALRETEDG